MSVTVDTSQFNAAFRQYLTITSRTMAEALNGKLRDWLLNAAAYAPFKRTEFSQKDYDRVRSQAFITYKTNQTYGENPPGSAKTRKLNKSGEYAKRKGDTLGPGQKWNMVMRNKRGRQLRRRMSGLRGYMASALVKTALKFAPIKGKSARVPALKYGGSFTGGRVSEATPGNLASTALCFWKAKSSDDKRSKEQLVGMALAVGYRTILADMIAHTKKKMAEAAQKVSA